jgi:hypothetical protein
VIRAQPAGASRTLNGGLGRLEAQADDLVEAVAAVAGGHLLARLLEASRHSQLLLERPLGLRGAAIAARSGGRQTRERLPHVATAAAARTCSAILVDELSEPRKAEGVAGEESAQCPQFNFVMPYNA